MKFKFIFSLLFFFQLTQAQKSQVGIFENNSDIGKPKIAGSVNYNNETQQYQIIGGGKNIWFNQDEFHYVYKKIKGNFILTANMKMMGLSNNNHRKIGWMVRENEKNDAAHISAVVHGDGLTALQWRRLPGAYMRDPQDEIFAIKKNPEIIQLERIGSTYIMRIANPGEPLQEIGRTEISDIPNNALVGLFVCSHEEEQKEEGIAWNVRIEKTIGETYDGYKDGILSSNMEIMNVLDGTRKIIYQDSGRFEAPNWMPDGKKLLFNQGGSIFTVSIDGDKAEKINTGVVKNNNNDHVISFDGKMLGVSSQHKTNTGNGSAVFILPLTGGEPILVTDSVPSYLHGWNPNGKEVVYTAKRIKDNPSFNIYKKNISGGDEVRLTFNQSGLDDGPEYSPDGKYIYFNSTKTGTMQLWKMKNDGTSQEQITFDEYNNWFPHISPDGKWIAFLSFNTNVASGDHPFYKRVMLRLMPVTGGAPKVIAYLYGGQGTINTPSWSPDSKNIAFVSNTLK
jgi:TolB protein